MKLKNIFEGKQWLTVALLLAGATVISSCSDDDDDDIIIDEPTGTISVSSQFYEEGNEFLIDAVSLTDDGWVVIHRDNGNNGPVVPGIISEPVFLEAGVHNNVMVELADGEEVEPGETLWAMLHLDNGQEMVYEFDGGTIDPPLTDDDGNIVMESFVNEFTFGTNSVSYPMQSVNGSGITGMVTITEGGRSDGAYVTIEVDGTPEGGDHPAHIHDGMAGSGGAIAFPLENVDGDTGMSTTFLNNITYENLLAYDGYVNVHLSEMDLTIVSTGNIGANGATLTGESTSYPLDNVNFTVEGDTITGEATLYELSDGSTWLEIELENTPDGGKHPAHIHANTAAEGGGIVVTLDTVNGTTGLSRTLITATDADVPLSYAELLDYDGYINVHLSADELATIVAQGDIGQNAFTGEMVMYTFSEVNESGVTGTATFKERANGDALVILDMEGTVDGASHPAHIHEGTAGSGGPIAISLNPVNGTTGMSFTEVSMFDDETPTTYQDLLTYNGYINVHLDAATLAIVATTNIGANADQ